MRFGWEFKSLRSLNQVVKQHFQALIGGDKCCFKPICPYLYTLLRQLATILLNIDISCIKGYTNRVTA